MKSRTALLSVASNSILILAKVIAGTLTGSVAVLTEAVHSSIDLVASLVAFVSLRIADEPADERHRYGHEKMENLAAAFEAILILVGSAAIAFEAIRRLLIGGTTHTLGVGIAVIGASAVANLVVGVVVGRNARVTESPALQGDSAHLLTDSASSMVVLTALILVQATGIQWIDPVAALLVSATIVTTGVRLLIRSGEVLVDQSLPDAENEAIARVIEGFGGGPVVGFHELRTRRGGSKRYVDVHVQFRSGTSLEQAHRVAHELKDQISDSVSGADVLIHLEPEDRLRPGQRALLHGPAREDGRGP
ncbi:MAG: cation diffusion facilitator family transporter [Solirubrobacteraceae bacterium]